MTCIDRLTDVDGQAWLPHQSIASHRDFNPRSGKYGPTQHHTAPIRVSAHYKRPHSSSRFYPLFNSLVY